MINKGLSGKVYDEDGLCPTITASEGVKYNIKIIQRGHGFNKGGKYKIVPTITGSSWSFNNLLNNGLRIRRLTERECFRLMDVPEEYIDLIQASGVSKSQQFKMAGNSIVVSCLYHIFDKLFVNNKEQLTLF